jgi:hypothetical protein
MKLRRAGAAETWGKNGLFIDLSLVGCVSRFWKPYYGRHQRGEKLVDSTRAFVGCYSSVRLNLFLRGQAWQCARRKGANLISALAWIE